jgi:hypothetical protein
MPPFVAQPSAGERAAGGRAKRRAAAVGPSRAPTRDGASLPASAEASQAPAGCSCCGPPEAPRAPLTASPPVAGREAEGPWGSGAHRVSLHPRRPGDATRGTSPSVFGLWSQRDPDVRMAWSEATAGREQKVSSRSPRRLNPRKRPPGFKGPQAKASVQRPLGSSRPCA